MAIQLEIVTPASNAFSGSVPSVIIPAWDGQMGIYPQHDPILTLLHAGHVTVEGGDKFVIGRGFAEVGPSSVVIMTESCEKASDVDKTAAKAALEAATGDLKTAAFGSEARKQAEIALEHAQARLDA